MDSWMKHHVQMKVLYEEVSNIYIERSAERTTNSKSNEEERSDDG